MPYLSCHSTGTILVRPDTAEVDTVGKKCLQCAILPQHTAAINSSCGCTACKNTFGELTASQPDEPACLIFRTDQRIGINILELNGCTSASDQGAAPVSGSRKTGIDNAEIFDHALGAF